MKKFLIFLLSVIMVISMFCITAFAELENVKQQNEVTSFEDNIQFGLKVKGSNILIPLFVNQNYCNNFNLVNYINNNYADVFVMSGDTKYLYLDDTNYFRIYSNGSLYLNGTQISNYDISIIDTFAFIIFQYVDTSQNQTRGYKYITFNNGESSRYDALSSSLKNFLIANAIDIHSQAGYYVNLPGYVPQPDIKKDLLTVIIDTIKGFILGIGKTFSTAFQAVFMNPTVVNGVVTYQGLNSLSIMLLTISGMTLGYGIIRWITGLFRKES